MVEEMWRERVTKDADGCAEAKAESGRGQTFTLEDTIKDMMA